MARPIKDITGLRFGRWTVLSLDEARSVDAEGKVKGARWNCECTCGTTKSVLSSSLTGGRSSSCGCLNIDSHQSHGLSYHPLYDTWSGIRGRCLNQKKSNYKFYGARGVEMYLPWVNDPQAFIDWVESALGEKPSAEHTIDRIDNEHGHYEPGNLRWATQVEQTNNTRSTVHIEHNGVTRTLAQWCHDLGLSYDTTWSRLKRGWTTVQALSTPTDCGRRYRRRLQKSESEIN